MNDIRVKDWFLAKNMTQSQLDRLPLSKATIEKETEKAVFIRFSGDLNCTLWCPKSCLMSDEDINEEQNTFAKKQDEVKKGTYKNIKTGKTIHACVKLGTNRLFNLDKLSEVFAKNYEFVCE